MTPNDTVPSSPSHEDQLRKLYLSQKQTLNLFLKNGRLPKLSVINLWEIRPERREWRRKMIQKAVMADGKKSYAYMRHCTTLRKQGRSTPAGSREICFPIY